MNEGYWLQMGVQEEANRIRKEGENFKACLVVKGFS